MQTPDTGNPAASISRENAVALIQLLRDTYAQRAGGVGVPGTPSSGLAATPRNPHGTDATARELQNVLALLDTVDFSRADASLLRSSGHPVVEQLRQLAVDANVQHGGGVSDGDGAGAHSPEGTAAAALLRAVRPWLGALPWRYSYDERSDSPGLGSRMAWAELVGPIAPFRSERVCLGLTAIGAGVFYPAHLHPAVETYFVLHGASRWTAAGVTGERFPGDYILHPSNVIHAMETGREPLLAAYTWSGDVQTLSAYV
jgi:mannose-6-phosphate isomerase-like protein (cupin superfamily)